MKSAEQQMTLDDLLSFLQTVIAYNKHRTAENRRDMRFLYGKLDLEVKSKLNFTDL